MEGIGDELRAQAGLLEDEGDLVDRGGRHQRDHGLTLDVAEEGDLGFDVVGDGEVAATDDAVGLDADAAQVA